MHPSRRRKKRPNYGIRTVEVARGVNGFGFTISGQQPCILSCIVTNSPADQAGLRAGDFLISVNGISVSKITHDAVVNLIGNCVGPIQMTIAENYYSDSSDEDIDFNRIVNTRKPKYTHKPRIRAYKHEARTNITDRNSLDSPIKKVMKLRDASHVQNDNNASCHGNEINSQALSMEEEAGPIEYKAIVGYLGTIEMPKQLLPSTRLQTVCSCIRKLRQEKRNPTSVLMTILPTCLTLKNSSNNILAIYPTNRVVYISSSSDRDSRYFGLVTSAFRDNRNVDNMDSKSEQDIDWPDSGEKKYNNTVDKHEIEISNSCHVFVTDSKIVDHHLHARKAESFRISCTSDVVSGNCLEFPKSALYIVSLVQNMYKLQDSSEKRNVVTYRHNIVQNEDNHLVANSPQPSASSNSDSGIGFRDDCGNVSDRILVVEFPVHRPVPILPLQNKRPLGIDASNLPLESLDLSLSCESDDNYVLNNVRSKTFELRNNLGENKANNLSKGSEINVNLNNIRACENINFNKNVIDKMERNINCEDYLAKQNNKNDKSQNLNSYLNINNRLTCRAMPSTKAQRNIMCAKHNSWDEKARTADIDTGNIFSERAIDVPQETPKKCFESLSLNSIEDGGDFKCSVDNISMHSSKSLELSNINSIFKTPSTKLFMNKKSSKRSLKMVSSCDNLLGEKYESSMLNYKLSPKVYGVIKPNHSCEELNILEKSDDKCNYSSLQDLYLWTSNIDQKKKIAQSEPDVRVQCQSKRAAFELMCEENAVPKSSNTEGPAAWAASFEKLLEDQMGLHFFAEFLKKEFSAENIYFWAACERFRRLPCGPERIVEAKRIYDLHLASAATEPVNVDSQGRQCAEQLLQNPTTSIFDQAQKQIFNLMKFDSYPRFLKSDLYKQCLAGNINGPQLDTALVIQNTSSTPNKLKKSLSNAEDRRRKSLLPWHRKNRSKSKDRGESEYNLRKNDIISSKLSGLDQDKQANGNNIHSSKSSLTSLDLAMTSQDKNGQDENSNSTRQHLCRIMLNKEVTSVVQIKPDDTIQKLVNRMLDKRGLTFNAYEVFLDKHPKGLDINESAMKLSGFDVIVEQRVTFKLDLPNNKIIAVKSKCTKNLVDVLRPILQKYNYILEQVEVTNRDNKKIDILLPVTSVDGMRLNVQLSNEIALNRHSRKDSSTLDEITNKVYDEILLEKSELVGMKKSDRSSVKSEDWGSEHSSGIFGKFMRRDSALHERKKKNSIPIPKSKGSSAHSSVEDMVDDQPSAVIKKPLKAKWKPGIDIQFTHSESDELYEGLSRALKSRLDDQRGTEINFELPEFLKNKENDSLQENNSRKSRNSSEGTITGNAKFYMSEAVLHPKPERITPPISTAKNLQCSNYENRSIISNSLCNSNSVNARNNACTSSNNAKINNLRIYSPTKMSSDESCNSNQPSPDKMFSEKQTAEHKVEIGDGTSKISEPPPLPPKPKIVPIRPSNWGQNPRTKPAMFLEHPTSSFV